MRFSHRGRHVHLVFVLLLAAGVGAAGLPAETVDYAADARLNGARVGTDAIRARFVPLTEVFRLVEKQTDLKFVYDAERLPLAAEVRVDSGGEMSVARLLAEVSAQVAIVFRQRNGLVAVWAMGPDDDVAPPAAGAGTSVREERVNEKPPVAVVTPEFEPAGAGRASPAADSPPPSVSATESVAEAPAAENNLVSSALPASEPPALDPEAASNILQLDAMKIEGKVIENSAKGLTLLRQKSVVSIDALSGSELRKYISTDVSTALVHMPGIAMAKSGGAQFAVIRGLSERYNPVMLDGVSLPSPDPERQSPQLDVFPTRLMDALVVFKTFDPKLAGTSSGGSIDLRTQGIPDGRFADVQFGLRVDEGFFKSDPFYSYDNGGMMKQMFALGKSGRATQQQFTEEGWNGADPRPRSPMAGKERGFPVGAQFAASYGNVFPIGKEDKQLGVAMNFTYNSSFSSEESVTTPFIGIAKQPDGVVAKIETVESEARVAWGASAIVGLRVSRQHTFVGSVLVSQTADDSVRVDHSSQSLSDRGELVHELHYKQRSFVNSRIGGRHEFDALGGFELDWLLGATTVSQDEPDFRYSAFSIIRQPGKPDFYAPVTTGAPEPRAASRYWREGEEQQKFARANFKKELQEGKLAGTTVELGAGVNRTDRTYVESSVFFRASASSPTTGNIQTLAGELADSPSPVVPFGFYADANVTGKRNIDGAYAMIKSPSIAGRFQLAGGARLEQIRLTTSGTAGFSSIVPRNVHYWHAELGVPSTLEQMNDPLVGAIDERVALPTATFTWTPFESLNVRLAAFKTVAMPSSREIGPYITWDPITDKYQQGNVGLVLSDVTNYDFRIEYFGKNNDLFALSAFTKSIEHPIEKATFAVGEAPSMLSWINNPGEATVKGLEVEFRKNLGFIAGAMRGLTFGGNATWLDASVPVLMESEFLGTGTRKGLYPNRRLYDQPEWLANADLTWAAPKAGFSTTVSASYRGDSLYVIGYENYNLYRGSNVQVDWTLSQRLGSTWSLRFSAKNLTKPDERFLLDPEYSPEREIYRTALGSRSYTLSMNKSL